MHKLDAARQRAQRNWRHMLEMSSDTGTLVHYETTQLLNMLLGDTPLDSGVVNTVTLIWGLLEIVVVESGVFPEGASAAVTMLGGFLEFLVRCNNTHPTPLIHEVEARVTAMLYSLATKLPHTPDTHQQVAPYVPFLLHVCVAKFKSHKTENIEIFGTPPREIRVGTTLSSEDAYIWLSLECLNLVDTAYFSQLLRYTRVEDDRMLQVAYVYELLEQSVFWLNRSLEGLYSVPLCMQPKARRGSAEPKVNPRKVLSFLVDEDTGLIPPGDYSTTESVSWSFDRNAADIQCATLLHRMTVLKGLLPLSPSLATVDRPIVSRVLNQQLRFVCGTLHWILVTLLTSIHNMYGIQDTSPLIPLWKATVSCLFHTIKDFSEQCEHLDSAETCHLSMLQLLKACLHVIAIDKAFLSYHPQGSLDVLQPFDENLSVDEQGSPAGYPLLRLLEISHIPVLYMAFTGLKGETVLTGSRPPLEMCIASFLHSLFTTHLEISRCSTDDTVKRAAVAVPIQNIFRGIHDALISIINANAWQQVFTPLETSSEQNLSPNWLKATEIAKAFAALPFGESVTPSDVDLVSQNAWTLVHYYFQLSIPCAPTAPPLEVSHITPGQGWDDYEEYFRDLEQQAGAGVGSDVRFPPDFGLSDHPGSLGYRLHQLLSSHLRGILTIVPYFHILFVANKRECRLEQCAYYCSSVADLIGYSAHNHGVAVPFLRASLECYEGIESPQALATVDKLEKIFLVLMDLPSASLVQTHGKSLASMFSDSPSARLASR
eukprot:TRINITY_DN24800_c0_g1_i1.p1 TRINITY_DN24800_c0_g1~~TRINITY_DN24800_c0_g1_i1.p1  ORF type:complete len:770 (+),score=159.94 TRINITY_DN24800_c0_g1_i1:63-2372(+)